MTETFETIRFTADVVAVTPDRHVLLIERGWDPYEGHWALPGGHVDPGETSLHAAVRELEEETGVRVADGDLHQIGTWDAPGRDPRGRYVTVAYLAHVPVGTEAVAGDDARTAKWVPLDDLPEQLAFDHADILRAAALFASDKPRSMAAAPADIEFVSFGYLHDQAPEAELVVDMRRHFRDPHVSPELRELTAADERVMRAVLGTDGVPELADAILAAVAAFRSGPSGDTVRVAIGCAGGRHRSAAMVQHLAERMPEPVRVTVAHRDIHRPVVDR